MTETYYIEDNSEEINITFGHFVEKVFNKQVKNYGEVSATKTRDRVKDMFKKCFKLDKSDSPNKNVLLVGKVQSGKTSNLEMFTAFAFDNGYKCVIIYCGYDTKLLNQTSDRFKKTFDVNDESIDSDEPELFSTDDDIEVNSLDEDVIRKIVELNKPIIFVSMKRVVALDKINKILDKIVDHKLKTFIIDDEGDQASLNTQFKRGKKSATYDKITQMKEKLSNPLYLSVTATPQANVLLGQYSQLKPEKLFLIEPGNGYTGASFFHIDESRIFEISEKDIDLFEEGKIPKSLYTAVNYFLVASAIMKKRGFYYTDMIIHTHGTNKEHSFVFSYMFSYIQSLKDNIADDDFELEIQLQEISKVYNDDLFSKSILVEFEFDALKETIKSVIKDTHIILQDSLGAATQGNDKYRNHKIFIGGNLLQRGLTFKYLIATYFLRWAKSGGQMDTTMQRARWFGYRSKYLELCKIFTTNKIKVEYSGLTESENDLWEQCYSIENGDLAMEDIVIDANSSTLNPTRPSVALYKKVKFTKKWNNQKRGFFDKSINDLNNSVITNLLSKLEWKESSVGRIGTNIPSCFYSYINYEQAMELVYTTSSIFDYAPFNRKELRRVLGLYPIVLEKMYGLFGKNDSFRERTFNQNTSNILALQQGTDSADEAFKKYKGDSYVIVDENAITIQIFKIRPRFDKHKPLEEFDQYMFSIHIPEARKGFVKNDKFKIKN